jgi:hypothetical protein
VPRDNITYVQAIADGHGTTTVVAGLVRGERITRYFVRRLTAPALAALQRDVDVALRRGEDVELTLAAWSEVEGE